MTPEYYERRLLEFFRTAPDKHEAHRRSAPLLREMTGDAAFVREALRRHVQRPGALNTKNYPVVGIDLALNEHFGLVINCWIPLPDRDHRLSTKAVHHHGDMLLSTGTISGPGYEHWLFSRPKLIDPDNLLFDMTVVEKAPHPAHHVAFVGEHTPHLPWYPPDTTLTLCLWSSRFPVTWKDRVKRLAIVKRNEQRLRATVNKLGLGNVAARAMDLKVVELFDFYPVATGFQGMRERQEYERGPNVDHLYSLFHVIQHTGNDALGSVIEEAAQKEGDLSNRALVDTLLADLKSGRPIEGRLSSCHLGLPHAVFSQHSVDRAVAALRGTPEK